MTYADTIFYGETIRTMDSRLPYATAIVVLNGWILAVGADQKVLALEGLGTTKTVWVWRQGLRARCCR